MSEAGSSGTSTANVGTNLKSSGIRSASSNASKPEMTPTKTGASPEKRKNDGKIHFGDNS